jgi:CheY-like chemotaxis protein
VSGVNTPEPSAAPIVVAIVDTNPEIVRLLRVHLENSGFVAIDIPIEEIKTGVSNLQSMLAEHDPKVIVYDIAPPYEQSWRFLQHLRSATDFKGRQFVLTAVNVRAVREALRHGEMVHEIIGKDEDILAVVRAVKEASRARPTR